MLLAAAPLSEQGLAQLPDVAADRIAQNDDSASRGLERDPESPQHARPDAHQVVQPRVDVGEFLQLGGMLQGGLAALGVAVDEALKVDTECLRRWSAGR